MSDENKEVKLHSTIDAVVWAKEFVRINGGDEDLMRGWFANAIMTGFDEGHRRGVSGGRAPCSCESVTELHHGDCASNDPNGAQS